MTGKPSGNTQHAKKFAKESMRQKNATNAQPLTPAEQDAH